VSEDQTPAELANAVPTTEPDPYPRYSLAERKKLIATLPWVARLDQNPELQRTCTQLLSGTPRWAYIIASQELVGMASPEDRAKLTVHRCNRQARYVYVDVENRLLVRCFMHAAQMLVGYSMAEEERYHAWLVEHPVEPLS